MQDLLETIQASEEEIKTHLKTMHACQIDGNLWHKKSACISIVNVGFPEKLLWCFCKYNLFIFSLILHNSYSYK